MDKVFNSLLLNKTKLKEDLKEYSKGYRINKLYWVALALLVCFIAFITIGIIIYNFNTIISFVLIILGSLMGFGFIIVYKKAHIQNKINYSKFLEANIKRSFEGKLLINPFLPLFLEVDDEKEEFIITYKNEIIISCLFEDIKNYKLYYNDSYEAKQRLPKDPLRGIKKYTLEIIYSNGEASKINFINNYYLLMVNDKMDFLQYVNTESINNMATILDKVLKLNKKK